MVLPSVEPLLIWVFGAIFRGIIAETQPRNAARALFPVAMLSAPQLGKPSPQEFRPPHPPAASHQMPRRGR
ncbi:hypothetical protein BRCON_2259 [Candidatus Sumerlaea chitinivorans]|uniref:Uncharacterized protein n=1 Tax=Sumerlaea chitinivorans TaxID=2250252 RepID=A0A2Z4Y7N6_SUMC1|nr:hypothetical protein BRCON_2259 [Candidatus Sumerlaea chitinivorans]